MYSVRIFYNDYNVSAQKTPAVRKNVRGMNAPIVYKPDIIPTDFSSGIWNLFWPDVLPSAEIPLRFNVLLYCFKRNASGSGDKVAAAPE